MGAILTSIMADAAATYAIMSLPGKADSIDVDAEIEKLDAKATQMADAQISVIGAKYDALMEALPASFIVRKEKYRLERFMSDDAEEFGEKGIRMTLTDLLAMANENVDKENEEILEKQEKRIQENSEKRSKKRIAEEKKEEKRRKKEQEEQDKKAKKALAKEHKDDLLMRAHSVAKMAEHNVENFTKTKEEAFKEEEAKIDADAKLAGYAKGAEDVQKYNEVLSKNAKKIVDKIRKVEKKVEILKKKIEQTVKLKLGALLGL